MPGKVLVYGGKGGLGHVVVETFKELGYWVLSVDIVEQPSADHNVLVSLEESWTGQEVQVTEGVGAALNGTKLEAVINVAGGWAGGKASDPDWIKNADLMWKQSVWSSAITARLAAKYLAVDGLVVLPGAEPAQAGTPGMIGKPYCTSSGPILWSHFIFLYT